MNAAYLILIGLSVPALTFTGLWFWRLRHQRGGGGQLTETELAARIAARQEELGQEREARDERMAGLIAHLLQHAVDARSELHAVRSAVERASRR